VFFGLVVAWHTAGRAESLACQALTERGIAHFRRHEYTLAIADFEACYAKRPVPDLLFNIAQSQRLNGDCEQALATYRRFLLVAPRGPLRDRATEEIPFMELCSARRSAESVTRDAESSGVSEDSEPEDRSATTSASSTPGPAGAPPATSSPPTSTIAAAPMTANAAAPAMMSAVAAATMIPATRDAPPRAVTKSKSLALIKRPWFWIVVATGAAATAAAVGVGLAFGSSAHYPTPSLGHLSGN
jgi:hypothetical protein